MVPVFFLYIFIKVVRDQAVIGVTAVRWIFFNPVMSFQTMKYHLRFLKSHTQFPHPMGAIAKPIGDIVPLDFKIRRILFPIQNPR